MKLVGMAAGFGLVGVLLAAGAMKLVALSGSSINNNLLPLAAALPLAGLYAAMWVTMRGGRPPERRPLHHTGELVAFTALGAVFGAAAMYLTFVVLSGTWHHDVLAPEHRSFFYQATHPDVLPELVRERRGGRVAAPGFTDGWRGMTVLGLVIGGAITGIYGVQWRNGKFG